MSDKARELAKDLRDNCNTEFGDELDVNKATALIDAALKAARLEAIEECKAAVETWASSKVMIHVAVLLETLDALKEAPDADAE
jgi:hypothetical protein